MLAYKLRSLHSDYPTISTRVRATTKRGSRHLQYLRSSFRPGTKKKLKQKCLAAWKGDYLEEKSRRLKMRRVMMRLRNSAVDRTFKVKLLVYQALSY